MPQAGVQRVCLCVIKLIANGDSRPRQFSPLMAILEQTPDNPVFVLARSSELFDQYLNQLLYLGNNLELILDVRLTSGPVGFENDC